MVEANGKHAERETALDAASADIRAALAILRVVEQRAKVRAAQATRARAVAA